MKFKSKATAMILGAVLTVNGFAPCLTVTAQELVTNTWPPAAVTATYQQNGMDYVYLSNGAGMRQSDFRKYSGEDFDLQVGDVVELHNIIIQEIVPGQIVWDYPYTAPGEVVYLGRAEDVFADQLVDLTVTSFDGEMVWMEGNGRSYWWIFNLSRYGMIENISWGDYNASTLSVGDVLTCAVEDSSKIIVPVALKSQAVYDTGDLDGNGTVELLDVITLNRSLLGVSRLSRAPKQAADVNADGSIDSTDSLLVLQYTVHLVDALG